MIPTRQADSRCRVRCQATDGFSLIEVMVSLVVIAVAVFGTARIQALSIGATHNSGVRSMVSLQAASLAAAMRANEAYWLSGSPPTTVTSYSASTAVTTLDASLSGITTDCASGTCTPLQMAAYDLKGWLAALQAQFPASGAAVSCAAATSTAPVTCTIEIDWTEKTIATSSATAAGSTPSTQKFQLVVLP